MLRVKIQKNDSVILDNDYSPYLSLNWLLRLIVEWESLKSEKISNCDIVVLAS